MRRLGFAVESVESRAIHHINIKPAIVVVIQKSDSRTGRLKNVIFCWSAHGVAPRGQASFLGNVFEDDRTVFYETTRRDGTLLRIKDRRKLAARSRTALLRLGAWVCAKWRRDTRSLALRLGHATKAEKQDYSFRHKQNS